MGPCQRRAPPRARQLRASREKSCNEPALQTLNPRGAAPTKLKEAPTLLSLSIVMPTLNQRAFLAHAVRSVFAQDLPGLELVVADGGSRDGTPSLLAELAEEHPGRLRWVSAPDSGPAAAVNRAVALAEGEVIGWLNSDDCYTLGAAARALTLLQRDPALVMVYGAGEQIDVQGRVLGPYPTRPPATPRAAFAEGCFICQPTAFFRRATFLALGALDESLHAAFDFDLWLRLFAAHPGQVAWVPQVQAQSRCHTDSITARERERVALEGLQVLHRHLGYAPPHWLLTHVDERCAQHPFGPGSSNLQADLAHLAARAEPLLSPDDRQLVTERLAQNRALQLATPYLYAGIWPDGWAPRTLEIRLRQPTPPAMGLRITGTHAHPGGGRTQLTASAPDGQTFRVRLANPGPFEWTLPISERLPDAQLVYRITADRVFVPAALAGQSTDSRELAWRLDHVALVLA
ncbi:MAG: glycosyltransferase [Gammaproteobacteria bacterium]|nr:glycosyltransferase [Gammaproteobacteria bacterium]